ncbi:GNAT family N-acetyltransferase [Actinacidiphila sp. bgisy167]
MEADIPPADVASIRLVERLGFEREGYSPRFPYLDGAWRGHE